MASPRNIDIRRIPKKQATRSANPGLDIKRKTLDKPRDPRSTNKKNSTKEHVNKKSIHVVRGGYFTVLASAFRSIAVADIFQFAFVRNLFSLRVLLFATLPIFVYQLRYIFVLKPDELLEGANLV